MKKKINFNRIYLVYILSIVICYTINGSLDDPLEWYLIAIVPLLFTLAMYVVFMMITFLIASCVSINQLLKHSKCE